MILSSAIQDYLKVIFTIQEQKSVVTTGDIARMLDVSAASVTGMMKRLDRMQLVVHESYKGVRLTESGEKIALEIIRHHRLLETYLREMMGYPWEKMHDEAEHLEHHISEEFEERIDALLGHPTHDPHGHPIPTRDLKIIRQSTTVLSRAPKNQTLAIHHLSDTNSDILHLAEKMGLMPGSELQIIDQTQTGMTVRTENQNQFINNEIADSIYVVV
ncbi:MAG: metal-dependent transcriptional regulator [Bacteroidetes bacterium]|nr:metal-dependent transcriptional regulator [Bacteroidota bacterium]